jgi:insulysin
MAISINSGTFQDPKGVMGCAHLLEHMVFMGSESFVEEDGFDTFIRKSSGQMNAHTCWNSTAYGFTCQNDQIEEGFHRLSDMLQKPLLHQENIDREKQAVNEEFRIKIANNGYRNWLIFCDLIQESHPLHLLGCGNAATLEKVSSEDLKTWHQQHYNPQSATLVLLSNSDIETQKEWVQNYLADWIVTTAISNEKLDLPQFSYDTHYFVKQLALDGKNTLDIHWPIEIKDPETGLAVSHLNTWICQEIEGGLCSFLKEQGYALSITSFFYYKANMGVLFLSIDLTDKGIKEIKPCLEACQSYLDFLGKTEISPNWLIDQQNIVQNNWASATFEASLSQGFYLADALADENLETYPYRSKWPTQSSVEKAQEIARGLFCEKAFKLISVTDENLLPESKKIQSNVEPWSQSPYDIIDISKETSDEKHSIDFSKVKWVSTGDNPFLPQTLPGFTKLDPSESATVINEAFGNLIYYSNAFEGGLNDSLLWVIKVEDKTKLIDSKVFWPLFQKIAQEKLFSFFEKAIEAGQSLRFSPESEGLSLSITGYSSSTQQQVMKDFFAQIMNLEITQSLFENQKQLLADNIQASLKKGPSEQFVSLGNQTFLEDVLSLSETAKKIQAIDFKTFQQMYKAFTQAPIHFEVVAISTQEPHVWTECLSKIHKSCKEGEFTASKEFPQYPFKKKWKDSISKTTTAWHEQNEGNLMTLIWDLPELNGVDAEKTLLKLKLFESDLHSSAFHNLRTQQQLGYIVQAGIRSIGNKPCLILLVLSSNKTPAEIASAMEKEILEWKDQISKTDRSSFNALKERLQEKMNQPVETSYAKLQGVLALWPQDKDPYIIIERQKKSLDELSYEETLKTCLEILNKEPYQLNCLPQQSQAD